jgi:hypothetical protein
MAPGLRHGRHVRRSTAVAHLLVASPRRTFLVALVLTFLNFSAWSLATPLFASPDEPTQVARAVSLVRGELIGRTIGSASNANTGVTIPELYSLGGPYAKCFAFKDEVAASCAGHLSGSRNEVKTTTYAGRYPPLYYAIVGLPSLLTVSSSGIYLMRLTSDLMSATFLALAIMSIVEWSKKRNLLVGLLLAATPMTFFLGGVVNPSGLEITSAICLWCSGLVLALERSQAPPSGLVATAMVAAATLMLSRGMSPLWVAVIIVILASVAGRHGLFAIARSHAARWSLVLLVPSAAFALIWIHAAHALDLVPGRHVRNGRDSLFNLLLLNRAWIKQMVGVFGWLDTRSPLATYLIWGAAVSLLVVFVVLFVRFRYSAVLLITGAMVLLIPVIISRIEVHRLGLVWQGRYIMPIAVGVPLLAIALLERSERLPWAVGSKGWSRLTTALFLGIGFAQFAAFTEAMRRYAVGVSGPINFFNGSWRPPLGVITVLIGFLVVMALLLSFIRHLIGIHPTGSNIDPTQPIETSHEIPTTVSLEGGDI